MNSLRRKLLLVAVLIVTLVVGYVVLKQFQLKRAVTAYQNQLRAQGEKMTYSDLTPRPSTNGPNGASAFVNAAGRLGALPLDFSIGAMKTVAPGRARVAWAQPALSGEKTNNVWPAMAADLGRRQGTLAEVSAALECPVLRIDLDYSQGFNLLLPHLSKIKTGIQWLSAGSLLDLHEGRHTNAWEKLRAEAALAQHYKDEPILISLLVRLACAQIALNTTWEALQAPGWNDAELAELQARWTAVDLFAHAELAFAMERVMLSATLATCRDSFQTAQGVMASGMFGGGSGAGSGGPDLGKEFLKNPGAVLRRTPLGYLGWKWLWSYEDELAYSQLWHAAVEATRLAAKGGSFVEALRRFDATAADVQHRFPNAGDWSGDLQSGELMRKSLLKLANMERQRRLLVCALALKRCELRRGHAPGELTALVPEFLASVPLDPMDAKPLRYRLNPDGTFLLYSIGEDGEDNGGDPAPVATDQAASKAWWRARDTVWPQPATAAEVKAAEEQEPGRKRLTVAPPVTATTSTNGMSEELRRAFMQRYGMTAPTSGSNAAPTAAANSNRPPAAGTP